MESQSDAFNSMARKLVQAVHATPNGRGRTRGLTQDQWTESIGQLLESAFNSGYAAGALEERKRQRPPLPQAEQVDGLACYVPIDAKDVPSNLRWDVPPRNAGKIVQVSYADIGSIAPAELGSLYKRRIDASDGLVEYFKRRTKGN